MVKEENTTERNLLKTSYKLSENCDDRRKFMRGMAMPNGHANREPVHGWRGRWPEIVTGMAIYEIEFSGLSAMLVTSCHEVPCRS